MEGNHLIIKVWTGLSVSILISRTVYLHVPNFIKLSQHQRLLFNVHVWYAIVMLYNIFDVWYSTYSSFRTHISNNILFWNMSQEYWPLINFQLCSTLTKSHWILVLKDSCDYIVFFHSIHFAGSYVSIRIHVMSASKLVFSLHKQKQNTICYPLESSSNLK